MNISCERISLYSKVKLCLFSVACPAGSYLNVTLDRCVLCSRGYFQEHQMQTECEICAEGFTKEEGAITAKKCTTYLLIYNIYCKPE